MLVECLGLPPQCSAHFSQLLLLCAFLLPFLSVWTLPAASWVVPRGLVMEAVAYLMEAEVSLLVRNIVKRCMVWQTSGLQRHIV